MQTRTAACRLGVSVANTEYKAVSLEGLDPFSPVIGPLTANTLMRWGATRSVMLAQDTAVAGSRRIVAWVGMGGAEQPLQPNSVVEPVDEFLAPPSITTFPNIDQWRTKGEFRVRVTPGCLLRARCIYLPSGATHRFSTGSVWVPAGAFGQIRVRVTWTGPVVTGPNQFTATLPASGLQYGQEPAGFSGYWSALRETEILDIRPAGFFNDPEVAMQHCQSVEASILLQVRGGVRDVVTIVWEEPRAHVHYHDDVGPHAVHGATGLVVAQTQVPQTEAADGVTYEENRFGTNKLVDTGAHQDLVLGPRIAEWSSWDEDTQPIADNLPSNPLQQQPASTSSTSFVGVVDLSVTAWSEDAPGYVVGGAHAARHHLNEASLVMVGGTRAVVPVRIWCRARYTDGGGSAFGIVRFQTSPYEWIDLTFETEGTTEEIEAFGFFSAQVNPDDPGGLLVPLMRIDTGTGTVEVWEWSVDWYDSR